MDKTTISLNLENLNDDERKLLMSLVEKGNKPKSKVWKPKLKDAVYILYSDGEILHYNYDNRLSINYELGNLFPTKEAAEEELKRRKIIKRWKDLSIESGEEDNPWDGKCVHYYAYFDYSKGSIEITNAWVCRCKEAYFTSSKSIKEAITEIGKENVKKYILNVKE